ncbi:unnamed protein product [Effrenium voratum]|uniref:Uncharacterized protein n=1 Tax=Effrenium voratum TaxID=2562239 RepID=A0AA36IUC2_9DINO|nr:unnamed protein product [Effrenium voratum]CAJ1442698.1 unnamed protein product [Effrenium voratum]
MLPKLDLHGGRGHRDQETKSGSEAVVALPKLRLLRQVGRDEHEPSRVNARTPRANAPRSPRSPSLEAPKRGRGMRPGREVRSPSPVRHGHHFAEEQSFVPQQDAQHRVRQVLRQKRRKAKEEEELKALEEKERQERQQKSLPQVEAYRRELARKAAEMHRRERATKETAAHEQEQLASARRERVNRYLTPDVISTHLRRFEESSEMSQSGEERERKRPAGSSIRRAPRMESESREVVICGSFATGSVRARHKVMLSPRRQEKTGTRPLQSQQSLPKANLLDVGEVSAASTAAEPRVPERSEQPEAPKEEPQLDTEVPPAAESSPPEQPAPSEGPVLPQPAPTDPAPPEPVADALETPAPAEPAPAEPAPAEPASAEPAEPASAEPAEPIAGKAEEHHEAQEELPKEVEIPIGVGEPAK